MLDNINNITSRMNQIENRIQQGPQINSDAFRAMMGKVEPKPEQAAAKNLGTASAQTMLNSASVNPLQLRSGSIGEVKPLAQNNGISCGQTSVAMCVNAVTGKNMIDADINSKYGFSLLDALNSESSPHGVAWRDAGNMQPSQWSLIDHKVNQEKTPVIVALNGPEFSPSGRGHIVTIVKTEGDNVTIADPATGQLRTTTKQAMNDAPPHPDGNFIFYAAKEDGASNVAMK
jgi:predicted double-glycine peptidase